MDSSRTFEPKPVPAGSANQPGAAGPVRFRGHRGGIIPMHRALAHFRISLSNLITAAFLFVFFLWVWLALLPRICGLWSRIMGAGIRVLPLHAELVVAEHNYSPYLNFAIPYVRMEPLLPTLQAWSLAAAATLLMLVATFLLSDQWIPVIYLLRWILMVQATALFYFALLPARFAPTPDSYMKGLVSSGLALISAVPLLYGLTYYIFDFGLVRKALLTAIAMAHLTLFLPFQVLLQALVLQKTVLFMPVLYIVFGMPLDVLLIVAFYSWGMTWSFRTH